MDERTREKLRFPIGRFQMPSDTSDASKARRIETIATFPRKLRAAVEPLTDAQLDTRYRPEGWTVRQVVHHVGDSHLNSVIRFKWALTEDNPAIRTYYEDRWAELCDYRDVPLDLALSFLDALHARWVVLLRGLEPAQWKRTFTHPEWKEVTLDVNLAIYAWHCDHHLAHVTELARREGW
ncbi:MAG: bacillithiol transferase BstA [Gemmatimonadetes bacterium]|nr:bacillithiol transferase BstA [Gemmatimonadota bacterium]